MPSKLRSSMPGVSDHLKVIMSKSLSSSGSSHPLRMLPNMTSRSPKAQWEYSLRYSRKSHPKAGLNSTRKYGDFKQAEQGGRYKDRYFVHSLNLNK